MNWKETRNGNYMAGDGRYVVFRFKRGQGWGCMVGGKVTNWTRHATAEAAMAALEGRSDDQQDRHRVHDPREEPWASRIDEMWADLAVRKHRHLYPE